MKREDKLLLIAFLLSIGACIGLAIGFLAHSLIALVIGGLLWSITIAIGFYEMIGPK